MTTVTDMLCEKVNALTAERDKLRKQRDDLLAACKAVRDTCPCDPDITDRWQAAWFSMEAAITKATGGHE